MILNNYGQHIKDPTGEEIFKIYVGMAKIWTDIDRLIWAKIEEGETGKLKIRNSIRNSKATKELNRSQNIKESALKGIHWDVPSQIGIKFQLFH